MAPRLEPLPIGNAGDGTSINTDAVLLIGDRAIHASRLVFTDQWDLGAEWCQWTGLPFVFALWILRREAVIKCPEELLELSVKLQQSRSKAFENLSSMAAQLAKNTIFSVEHLEQYWRGMSYDLSDGHIEGLKLYFTLCHKHGLLDKIPEFHFFPEI